MAAEVVREQITALFDRYQRNEIDQITLAREFNALAGERQAVITVRLPASLHEKLKDQAHHLRISLNQLCLLLLTAEES